MSSVCEMGCWDWPWSHFSVTGGAESSTSCNAFPSTAALTVQMRKNQLNTLKWLLMVDLSSRSEQKLWGETVKRKMSPSKKCHHFDICSLLTFLHCCTRDSHFKCQQAHRSQGGWRGLAVGGYCGRADLIKQQAAAVRPLVPRRPISLPQCEGIKVTECNHCLLSAKWGEWVGMRLSDRPAVACPPCQPYWIMTRQEVARYEPRGAAVRYHGRGYSMRRRGGKVTEMKPVCM